MHYGKNVTEMIIRFLRTTAVRLVRNRPVPVCHLWDDEMLATSVICNRRSAAIFQNQVSRALRQPGRTRIHTRSSTAEVKCQPVGEFILNLHQPLR